MCSLNKVKQDKLISCCSMIDFTQASIPFSLHSSPLTIGKDLVQAHSIQFNVDLLFQMCIFRAL